MPVISTLAHPRSRGENHAVPLDRIALAWLIPARAGKTATPASWATSSAAHPRSRGENAPNGIKNFADGGSSPLARGKLGTILEGVIAPRLIPARAGKTRSECLNGLTVAAHPRSRGENSVPPSMRRTAAWLIPARAGKTRRVPG